VNNATACAKSLTKLLKSLPVREPNPELENMSAMDVLVESYLMWDANSDKARTGYDKLMAGLVDYNDLRVTLPHEIVEALGVRYPNVEERAQRLRATLRDIYMREHEVSLEPLHEQGKREVKKYLETLDGIPVYVASRTLLLGFDGHAIPVDDQLRDALIDEEAADASADVAELSNWLCRQIKASDALETLLKLQQWIDTGRRPKRRRTSSKKKTTRKRKTSSRKKRSTAARS